MSKSKKGITLHQQVRPRKKHPDPLVFHACFMILSPMVLDRVKTLRIDGRTDRPKPICALNFFGIIEDGEKRHQKEVVNITKYKIRHTLHASKQIRLIPSVGRNKTFSLSLNTVRKAGTMVSHQVEHGAITIVFFKTSANTTSCAVYTRNVVGQ